MTKPTRSELLDVIYRFYPRIDLNEAEEFKDLMKLSFHVSLLGPYYGIHLPGVPEEESVAREVAREIEATYPGYQRIPPELGDMVVPDLYEPRAYFGYFGVATIYICLFSDFWTWIRRG